MSTITSVAKTGISVANYINTRTHLMGEMQLHKLTYYAQAWSMVWTGRPLFDEDFRAWAMGPVSPNVRTFFSENMPPRADVLTDEQHATVDAVLEFYGHLNGTQLSGLTHTEDPWVDARGDLPPKAPSNTAIPKGSMLRYYTKQSIRGEGPRRPVHAVEMSDEDVSAIARRQATKWAETLRILADR